MGAESRQNPPLHHLHAHLDFGFIPGVGRAGWDDSHPIVLGELGVGAVEGGLIAMAWLTAALRLSGTTTWGTPPNAVKARTWDPIQSGRLWLQVASAKVCSRAPGRR